MPKWELQWKMAIEKNEQLLRAAASKECKNAGREMTLNCCLHRWQCKSLFRLTLQMIADLRVNKMKRERNEWILFSLVSLAHTHIWNLSYFHWKSLLCLAPFVRDYLLKSSQANHSLQYFLFTPVKKFPFWLITIEAIAVLKMQIHIIE